MVFVCLLHLFTCVIAGYGAFCFIKADIVSYMFLKREFVFFDFEKSIFLIFLEYIAIMGLWIWIGCYVAKGLRKLSVLKSK